MKNRTFTQSAVHRHLTFYGIHYLLYQSQSYSRANILCVEPKNFTPSKRESVLERIRDEDFDGIIITYSCFEQIPLSKEYYQNQLIDEQDLIAEIASKKNKATSRLKKKQEAVSKALSELAVAMDDLYKGVYFDDLGITRLFVDEAHNFKNVPIETKADKVLGVSASGSKKCQDKVERAIELAKDDLVNKYGLPDPDTLILDESELVASELVAEDCVGQMTLIDLLSEELPKAA